MSYKESNENNGDRIERIINDTIENINEAENFQQAHLGEMSEKDQHDIDEKNRRRRDSVDALRHEIEDER
ncbi:small acid-soluble spore protein Tlp [Geomicrobium sediminis]|uniref:Small acid-soluble spore protein (Thioredoxin-like protein) n=1 Tax=Geomicrobium sediminis TaxID=1347788 RepID=A0ABS2PC20_9BACL|nr:small acid-soluble spore protein Tlp [Geomicrobium sediminis]MBM7632891.1 small acid-soluble spore protein (thioredoxin-like protein) [Geomicrobium sediminis]